MAVQSSSLTVIFAVQFESPITVESSVPLKFKHSQCLVDPPQPDPLQVPTIGVAWIPLPRMLNCSSAPCGVAVAVGAVEVGVLAVAVTVSVGTVVAVMVGVTSGKIPLPHPELGTIMRVNPTIIRMGRKRAIRANRAVGGLILGPGT